MLCVKCGHNNDPGVNYCRSCHSLLPKIDFASEVTMQRIFDRVDKIKDACEKVSSGGMTIEEFFQFIQTTFTNLTQRAQEITEIVNESNYASVSPEEVELGFAGMELYEQGLLELMAYAEDQDSAHLQNGLEMLTQGNDNINEAMRINRDNRSQLEWDVWI